MKKGTAIIVMFSLIFAGLASLLSYNLYTAYQFQQRIAKEKVETAISNAAAMVQEHNGGVVNNMARMISDKDFDNKLTFAAGFTHNKSKITVTFPANDDADDKEAEHDTVKHRPVPNINKEFLKQRNIVFKPSGLMGLHHFDSVFRANLTKEHLVINYLTVASSRFDTSRSADTIVSAQFILDFGAPDIYSVHYSIPAGVVFKGILPNIISTLMVCLLLAGGFVFYYRSYIASLKFARFKETVFGNVTHELKTPLSSLQLIVENAKENVSDDVEARLPVQHLQFAERELSRMKLIIDRILSFSKMSSHQFVFDKEWVDLQQVVGEAIQVMEINALQAGATINYTTRTPLKILGDRMLLVNAVTAIIDNAIKYAATTAVVDISLATVGQYAEMAISDNGPGIPRQVGKKIFEPFYRATTGDVHNVAGHGLGLSFAREVARLHDGDIRFASKDRGVTFYLKFKLS